MYIGMWISEDNNISYKLEIIIDRCICKGWFYEGGYFDD